MQHTQRIQKLMPGRIWITLEQPGYGADHIHSQSLVVSQKTGVPLVAAGNAHMHIRARQTLQDTYVQSGASLCGYPAYACAMRSVISEPNRFWSIFIRALFWMKASVCGSMCFSLDELRYHYPCEQVPDDLSPTQYLRQLVDLGIRRRWPDGPIEKVTRQISR